MGQIFIKNDTIKSIRVGWGHESTFYEVDPELKKPNSVHHIIKERKSIGGDKDKFMSPIGEWNRIFLAEGGNLS